MNTHAIFYTLVSGIHGFRVEDEPNEPKQNPKHDAFLRISLCILMFDMKLEIINCTLKQIDLCYMVMWLF